MAASLLAQPLNKGRCDSRATLGGAASRGRGAFIGTNLGSVPLLRSESLRFDRDLRCAWRELAQ